MQTDDHYTFKLDFPPRTDEFYLERMKEILAINPNAKPPSEPVEMVANVFMGNQKHAEDFKLLQRYGITHIVNCAGSKLINCFSDQNQRVSNIMYPEVTGISECLIIGAVDHEDYDISVHFDRAIDFLSSVEKKGGRTLVHCNLGVNRSGAIMVAYLMVRQRMSLLNAINYIKEKRFVVLSNRGFRKQLISFAKKNALLEISNKPATNKETNVFTTKENLPHHMVRFQSFDHWINCEDLDSKVILSENNSKDLSLKKRLQVIAKPNISGRLWSFSRSLVRWRSKTDSNKNEKNLENSKISKNVSSQLDPVYENLEESCNAQQTSIEDLSYVNNIHPRPSTRRSNSFLSLIKSSGRRMKSSSISDFQSIHPSASSASFLDVFDPNISSSAKRPLRISQSVQKDIISC